MRLDFPPPRRLPACRPSRVQLWRAPRSSLKICSVCRSRVTQREAAQLSLAGGAPLRGPRTNRMGSLLYYCSVKQKANLDFWLFFFYWRLAGGFFIFPTKHEKVKTRIFTLWCVAAVAWDSSLRPLRPGVAHLHKSRDLYVVCIVGLIGYFEPNRLNCLFTGFPLCSLCSRTIPYLNVCVNGTSG